MASSSPQIAEYLKVRLLACRFWSVVRSMELERFAKKLIFQSVRSHVYAKPSIQKYSEYTAHKISSSSPPP